MDANLKGQLEETNGQLFSILDSFDEPAINTLPLPGSWTAAQVGDHLRKSDDFIHYLLTGPVKETTREADEFVTQLRETFLNFEIHMDAPQMIIPDAGPLDKASLLQNLQRGRAGIIATASSVDLTRTTTVKSPLGASTLLELIYFHLFHTQRHIHQLRKIRQHLAGLVV